MYRTATNGDVYSANIHRSAITKGALCETIYGAHAVLTIDNSLDRLEQQN